MVLTPYFLSHSVSQTRRWTYTEHGTVAGTCSSVGHAVFLIYTLICWRTTSHMCRTAGICRTSPMATRGQGTRSVLDGRFVMMHIRMISGAVNILILMATCGHSGCTEVHQRRRQARSQPAKVSSMSLTPIVQSRRMQDNIHANLVDPRQYRWRIRSPACSKREQGRKHLIQRHASVGTHAGEDLRQKVAAHVATPEAPDTSFIHWTYSRDLQPMRVI